MYHVWIFQSKLAALNCLSIKILLIKNTFPDSFIVTAPCLSSMDLCSTVSIILSFSLLLSSFSQRMCSRLNSKNSLTKNLTLLCRDFSSSGGIHTQVKKLELCCVETDSPSLQMAHIHKADAYLSEQPFHFPSDGTDTVTRATDPVLLVSWLDNCSQRETWPSPGRRSRSGTSWSESCLVPFISLGRGEPQLVAQKRRFDFHPRLLVFCQQDPTDMYWADFQINRH